MKNYLFNLGKNAKKASLDNLSSNKKNKVLKDYVNLILNNQSKIILENQKDLKKARLNKLKENLVTTKGHPTDNMNLLEDNILDDTPIVEIFNDPLFRWLSSYSKDSDI